MSGAHLSIENSSFDLIFARRIGIDGPAGVRTMSGTPVALTLDHLQQREELADQMIRPAHKKKQCVEHLRLHRDSRTPLFQQTFLRMQFELAKAVGSLDRTLTFL